jgi:23S rRNA (cytosine1962-C5)-methyltransferase
LLLRLSARPKVMSVLTLKPGRDKSLRWRHPWIFSGAVASLPAVADGEVVDLHSAQGEFLARGFVNARSQIRARVLSWDAGETIDREFWQRRLRAALRLREGWGSCRLVHAEADGLPGLVADRYGDWLSIQMGALGLERCRDSWLPILAELAGVRGIFGRGDLELREREGLKFAGGSLWGEEPPARIEIEETSLSGSPLHFEVDVRKGHKTGFYLDQVENRRRVAAYCEGAEVLNVFAYTGAFAVHALAAGALRVLNVDSSAAALEAARRHVAINGFTADDADFAVADAFAALRELRANGASFDVIVLDPPKFVQNAAQIERASRAYKDLNRVALTLLRPGGILATFSCSGLLPSELFQKIVFGASLDAGREARILERLSQSPDHPILLSFPESEYLKGLIVRA